MKPKDSFAVQVEVRNLDERIALAVALREYIASRSRIARHTCDEVIRDMMRGQVRAAARLLQPLRKGNP